MTESAANSNEASDAVPGSTPTSPIEYPVKLYKLENHGVWGDQGTGICIYTSDPDRFSIRIEKDRSLLLTTQVLEHKAYQRQNDTLIVWTEDANNELALSFQDKESCDEIWQKIQNKVQASDKPLYSPDSKKGDLTPLAEKTSDRLSLPAPDLCNLDHIQQTLEKAKSLEDRALVGSLVLLENFIDKLLTTFEKCEDLQDFQKLYTLYHIMKSIFLLNDNAIIEYLIQDDVIFGVVGIMEYNPDTPQVKATHRETLKKYSTIEPVVPINDASVLSKIHQTFRLKYLNDIILRDCINDNLSSLLNSLIFFNYIGIVNYMQHDHEVLSDLEQLMDAKDTPLQKKKEAVEFVLQLCEIAKSLQVSTRAGLYRALALSGLFSVFDFALTSDNDALRTTAVQTLLSIAELDASLVRSYIMQQVDHSDKTSPTLIASVIQRFTSGADTCLKIQYMEIIKLLLNLGNGLLQGSAMPFENTRKQDRDIDQFLTMFYENYATMLLVPIGNLSTEPMKLDGPIVQLTLSHDERELYLNICELLCGAIRQHGLRSKNLMLSVDYLFKIVQLYRCQESHIKLAALRVIRTCVSLKDEFYNQHLIKSNIFEPTIRVLLDTDGRNNLLNSACLELLHFLYTENIKTIIHHLVTQFGSVLDTIHYVTTCKELRKRYNQNIQQVEGKQERLDTRQAAKQGGSSLSSVNSNPEEYVNQSTSQPPASPSVEAQTFVQSSINNYPVDDANDEGSTQEKSKQISLVKATPSDTEGAKHLLESEDDIDVEISQELTELASQDISNDDQGSEDAGTNLSQSYPSSVGRRRKTQDDDCVLVKPSEKRVKRVLSSRRKMIINAKREKLRTNRN